MSQNHFIIMLPAQKAHKLRYSHICSHSNKSAPQSALKKLLGGQHGDFSLQTIQPFTDGWSSQSNYKRLQLKWMSDGVNIHTNWCKWELNTQSAEY